jgi:hypothetical protein
MSYKLSLDFVNNQSINHDVIVFWYTLNVHLYACLFYSRLNQIIRFLHFVIRFNL